MAARPPFHGVLWLVWDGRGHTSHRGGAQLLGDLLLTRRPGYERRAEVGPGRGRGSRGREGGTAASLATPRFQDPGTGMVSGSDSDAIILAKKIADRT